MKQFRSSRWRCDDCLKVIVYKFPVSLRNCPGCGGLIRATTRKFSADGYTVLEAQGPVADGTK